MSWRRGFVVCLTSRIIWAHARAPRSRYCKSRGFTGTLQEEEESSLLLLLLYTARLQRAACCPPFPPSEWAALTWRVALHSAGSCGSTALSQPRLARMTENQDSLSALRAETLRGLAGQREREEEAERERDRGCWCCWLTVPVVLAVALALPVVWESHIRLWHNALTDPYTLGGVAVTFMCALYGLLQCIDLGDK